MKGNRSSVLGIRAQEYLPPPQVLLETVTGGLPEAVLTARWLGAWARRGSLGAGCLCSWRSLSICSSSRVFMDRPCLARPAQSGGGELGAGGTGTFVACCCCCSSFSNSSCCRTWVGTQWVRVARWPQAQAWPRRLVGLEPACAERAPLPPAAASAPPAAAAGDASPPGVCAPPPPASP